MKRDPDYICETLREFESGKLNRFEERPGSCDGPLFKGEDTEAGSSYQMQSELIRRMMDEGPAAEIGNNSSFMRVIAGGCDFLGELNDDTPWIKTRAGVFKAGGMTPETMKDLAVANMRQEAADKLGLRL